MTTSTRLAVLLVAAAGFAFLPATSANAALITWDGGTAGWTAANWGGGNSPASGNTYVASGATSILTVAASSTFAGDRLTISDGATLRVNGTITAPDGQLHFNGGILEGNNIVLTGEVVVDEGGMTIKALGFHPTLTSLTGTGNVTIQGSGLGYVILNDVNIDGQLNLSVQTQIRGPGNSGTGTSYVGSLAGSGILKLGPQGGSAGTRTLEIGADNTDASYSGSISDQNSLQNRRGAITKVGTGTQTLSGNNAYTGGTTISSGMLVVGHANALGTTGVITVDGGTLAVDAEIEFARTFTLTSGGVGGSGTFAQAVTIGSGQHVAPGLSIGTLSFNSLTLGSGSILNFEFDDEGNYDRIVVLNEGGLTINGGQFNFYTEDTAEAYVLAPGIYNLIQYSGDIGGSIANLSVYGLTSGYSFGTATVGDAHYVTLTIVPEPATMAFLAFGGLAMVGNAFRRRRKV